MIGSPLVTLCYPSPNHSGKRTHIIDTITIHHCAGNITMTNLGAMYARPERKGSANYGIGSDGTIAQFVSEDCRSWCSNNEPNDQRAITIEVANCGTGPDWPISDKAREALIELCADIVRRNKYFGGSLRWRGSPAYIGLVRQQNITLHKWLYPTACPGPTLEAMIPDIVEEVNDRLGADNRYYTIQIAAFTDRENAQRMLSTVHRDFPDAFIKEVYK